MKCNRVVHLKTESLLLIIQNILSIEKADLWLDAREPVISLAVNNEINVYPLQLMIFHKIVNDNVGGIPVAVTFCPLCNSSIVFDHRVEGRGREGSGFWYNG